MGKTIDDYSDLVKEKHALNKTIAPVETDETDASRAYAVGEQLIFNGTLYDVIAPISQHDVITTTGSGANIAPAGPISAKIQTLTNKLNDEVATRVELGAHQLLKYTLESLKANNTSGTWNDNAYTINGVTFTLNDDLTITATGTASAQTELVVHYVGAYDVFLKANTSYIASIYDGKGSNSTFKLVTYGRNASAQTTFDIVSLDCDGQEINHAQTSVGIQFTIRIMSGFNTNGIVFKPLLKFGADSSNELTPYTMTNRELTEYIAPITGKYVVTRQSYRKTISASNTKTRSQLMKEFYDNFVTDVVTPMGSHDLIAFLNGSAGAGGGACRMPYPFIKSEANVISVTFSDVDLTPTVIATYEITFTHDATTCTSYDNRIPIGTNVTVTHADRGTEIPTGGDFVLYFAIYQAIE